MTTLPPKPYRSLALRLSGKGLPPLVLWVGLLLTSITSYLAYDRSQLTSQLRFQEATDEIRAHIESRLQIYATALQQTRALFHLREEADRNSFRVLTEAVHPAAEYPGLIGIGFVEKVGPSQVAYFENRAREEYASPRISIWQSAEAAANHTQPDATPWAVRFLEPEAFTSDGQSAIGYDLGGDPQVLAAFAEARDRGRAALTRKVLLPFGPHRSPAFILALPVYNTGFPYQTLSQRRENLKGFVFIAFSSEAFFEGPVSKGWLASRRVRFAVYEDPVRLDEVQPKSEALYDHIDKNQPSVAFRPPLKALIELSPISHPLWLKVQSEPGLIAPVDAVLPWFILLTGSLLTLSLYHILRVNGDQSERLLKSERQLQMITDALPVLVCYIDRTETYRFNSRAYESWYRIKRENLTGRDLKTALTPETYDRVKPFVDRALRGELVSFETTIQLPDSKMRPVRADYVPDFAPDGSVKGFIGLISDMSEHKRTEDRSRFLVELSAILGASLEVEATLQRLATLISPAIADWCVIDLFDGDSFRRLTAYSHDPETRGLLKGLEASLLAEDDSHTARLVAKNGESILLNDVPAETLVPRGPHAAAEIEIVRKIGSASAMMVPLKARNHVLGALTLVASTPERKFNFDDLAFANDIARRAALAIDNARLYREASQASHAKDEFLATLSHELRTPMNVILGWLEMLSTETFDQDTFNHALSTLNRNAGLQLQLINDLLDVSKIVNGKVTLNIQRTDLAPLLESAVDGFQPAARAKSIDLRFDVLTTDTSILGDPNRIHQVLWNLLSNAIKFTPEKGHVHVRLESQGGALEISVEDSGRGIEPAFIPHIFDRFRQEESGSSRSYGGLGLGLSIVRHLVELHGGQIEARSDGRGRGSRFVLTFLKRGEPISTSDVYRQPPSLTLQPPAPVQTVTELVGAHVLVIDDSPDVRLLVERILARAGCRVTLAHDAKDAWKKIENEMPEVIVSDLGLPNEDGISLMRRWRENERLRNLKRIPAAAMTGFVQPDDEKRTIAAGYDLHVAKPVTAQTLLEAIKHLLTLTERGASTKSFDASM